MKLDYFIEKKLIPYIFIVSSNPILFHDLLEANRQLKDRLTPNSGALGYKIKLKNLYISFLTLIHLFFIIPGVALFHKPLAKLDCHLSIILAVVITGAIFIGFTAFRELLVEKISALRVEEGWRLHFPLFDYEVYSQKVADIYTKAVKKKVSRGELEFYIMGELAKDGDEGKKPL